MSQHVQPIPESAFRILYQALFDFKVQKLAAQNASAAKVVGRAPVAQDVVGVQSDQPSFVSPSTPQPQVSEKRGSDSIIALSNEFVRTSYHENVADSHPD